MSQIRTDPASPKILPTGPHILLLTLDHVFTMSGLRQEGIIPEMQCLVLTVYVFVFYVTGGKILSQHFFFLFSLSFLFSHNLIHFSYSIPYSTQVSASTASSLNNYYYDHYLSAFHLLLLLKI